MYESSSFINIKLFTKVLQYYVKTCFQRCFEFFKKNSFIKKSVDSHKIKSVKNFLIRKSAKVFQVFKIIVYNSFILKLRARLHETRIELKPVWNLKPLWNVVLFTWQFTWRFRCGNFPNNSKALLHVCKWYLLINVNLINAKKCFQ